MKIKATLVVGFQLKPGDLFSTLGSQYWDHIDERGSVGECVYIRTNVPASDFPDADAMVYRIEVGHDETRAGA